MNKYFNLRLGDDIYTYQEAIKRFGKHHVDNWYKYPEMLAGTKPRQTSAVSENGDVKPESGKKITQHLPSKPGVADRTMFDKPTAANPKLANLDDTEHHKANQSNARNAKMPGAFANNQVITEYYRREFTYNDFVQWHTANFNNGDDLDYIFNAYSQGTLGKDDKIVLHGTVTMYFAQHRAYYHMYNESGLPMSYTQDLKTGKYYGFRCNVFPTNNEMNIGQEMYKLVNDDSYNHPTTNAKRKASQHKVKQAFQSIMEPDNTSTGDKILRSLAEDKSLDIFTIKNGEGHATTYVKKKDQSDDTTNTYQPDVTHPNYYSEGGKDVIDCLPDLVGYAGTVGFLQGNVIKYTVRFQRKNGIEDLDKAKVYLDRLEKLYKEHNHDDHDRS